MNIIVVGCGKVGLTLADQLNKEGHDITIVDQDEKVLRHAVDFLDIMGIHGNSKGSRGSECGCFNCRNQPG